MKDHLPVLISCMAIAASAAAQWHSPQWPSPDGSARTHVIRNTLQTFQRASSSDRGPWQVAWSRASNTPKAIYGPGLRVHRGAVSGRHHAEQLASQLLTDHRTMLGANDGTEFVLASYGKVRHTHVLVFDQKYGGLRVLDGRADVRLTDRGIVSMFGSVAFPVPADLSLQPTIAAATAKHTTVANLALAEPVLIGKPELLIWASRTTSNCTPRLAWAMQVTDRFAPCRAYVDAHTGRWIEQRSTRHDYTNGRTTTGWVGSSLATSLGNTTASSNSNPSYVPVTGTVMAYVQGGFGPNGAPINQPMSGVEVQIQGGGSAFTDASGNFTIAHGGTAPVQVTVDFASGEFLAAVQTSQGSPVSVTTSVTPGSPATIQLTSSSAGEYELAQATAFYRTDTVTRFVQQAHILAGNPTLATVHGINVVVNDSQVSCNAFFDDAQNRIVHAASSTGCPNFAFPTVIEHEWGHALDHAFGGIGSAELAEGWADVITNYYTEQPLIGEDFNGPGQHVRDANNSAQYPSGQAHQGGLVWMGGSWKLRGRLIAKLGATAGQMYAETIVIGSILANASTIPDAVREVFLLDDDDGNLNNGTPNCAELYASYTTDHNIPSPVATCSANPGIVTAYGAGCAGTGTAPATCQSQNDTTTGSGLQPPAPAGFQIAYAVVAGQAMQITEVELFTQGGGGSLAVHRANGSNPAATPAATMTLATGSTPAWYGVQLPSPLSVASGETIYLVHDGGSFDTSLLNSGTVSASPTLVDPGFGWTTLPPGVTDNAAWRIGCTAGGQSNAVPLLTTSDLPEIGRSFTLSVSQAAASIPGDIILGLSDSSWNGAPLPLDLTPFGAPSCSLLAAYDATLPIQSNATGDASQTIPLPNDNSLVGIQIYVQAALWDQGANVAGVAVTSAMMVQIGTP